jgi:hypothetical protein
VSELRVELIVGALLAKGFFEAKKRDHRYFFFHYKGQKTSVYTKISHGQSTVDDWLLGRMAHQVRLSKREFLALIECTLGGDDYARQMVERGAIG